MPFLPTSVREAGGSLPEGGNPFSDDNGDFHEDNINGLAAAGIIRGTAPGRYSPQATVQRDQMATFVVNAYQYVTRTALPAGPDAFTDDGASFHQVNINKAAAAGFTKGTGATSYSPAAAVRRDQMASFLTRVYGAATGAR